MNQFLVSDKIKSVKPFSSIDKGCNGNSLLINREERRKFDFISIPFSRLFAMIDPVIAESE